MPKFRLESIENASVVRKFSVLFTFMSFLPFLILSTLFFIFYFQGTIKIDSNMFFWAVFLVGFFSLLGFLGVRQTLVKINSISEGLKGVLKGEIPQAIGIKGGGDNEVVQITRTFNEIVHRLEDNIKELEKSKSLLHEVLTAVSRGVSFAENIDVFVNLILKTTVSALDAKAGLLLLVEEDGLIVKSSFGLPDNLYMKNERIAIDTEVVSWVINQKKPLLIPYMEKASSGGPDKDLAFRPPLICVPLIFQNRTIGTLSISGKKSGNNFRDDDLLILTNISSQVALAIENVKLNTDAQRTYMETVTALALAVEARDFYSRGHSDRVGDYSVKMARKLNLKQEQVAIVQEAAELHDVGKIGISDEILRKPSSLTDYEREIIRQHPLIGEGIIIPLRGLSTLRDPIRHHHEWLNGEGYPDHLKGSDISIEARILTVADAFDAMTTDRPYRKAMSVKDAMQELERYRDIRYDGKVIDALASCI